MIPKVIHYCWFGEKDLPNSAEKCIQSWKSFFPDYKICRWDEGSFDVNSIPYTSEAYSRQKFAFVSDYARYWILYHYGGIYFDTDVEVVRSFSDIIEEGAFMGREAGTVGKVAPGLGLGIEPWHPIIAKILDSYSTIHFIKEDGSLNMKTIVDYTTEILLERGLHMKDYKQIIDGVTIYPSEYFCPMDSTTGIIRMTPNTASIHHYDCSWLEHNTLKWHLHLLKNRLNRVLYRFHLYH